MSALIAFCCAVSSLGAAALPVPAPLSIGDVQEKRTATVNAPAPLHGFPPPAVGVALRTVAADTVVIVLATRDGWAQIEYVDAQRVRHTGWLPQKYQNTQAGTVTDPKPQPPARTPPAPQAPPPAPKPLPPIKPVPPPVKQTQARPSTTRGPISIAAQGGWEASELSAVDTFRSLLGSSRIAGFALGAEISGLPSGISVWASIGRSRASGGRVFVIDGERIPLDIPLRLTMMPIEVTAGWRQRPRSGSSLYLGGGLILLRYNETTLEFAEPEDNIRTSFPGAVVHGGLSINVSRRTFLNAEMRFRTVPTKPVAGTLAFDFGENDLGGLALRIGVGVRVR
jgi:hypothetical protein